MGATLWRPWTSLAQDTRGQCSAGSVLTPGCTSNPQGVNWATMHSHPPSTSSIITQHGRHGCWQLVCLRSQPYSLTASLPTGLEHAAMQLTCFDTPGSTYVIVGAHTSGRCTCTHPWASTLAQYYDSTTYPPTCIAVLHDENATLPCAF